MWTTIPINSIKRSPSVHPYPERTKGPLVGRILGQERWEPSGAPTAQPEQGPLPPPPGSQVQQAIGRLCGAALPGGSRSQGLRLARPRLLHPDDQGHMQFVHRHHLHGPASIAPAGPMRARIHFHPLRGSVLSPLAFAGPPGNPP
jgi:hypothetical protein